MRRRIGMIFGAMIVASAILSGCNIIGSETVSGSGNVVEEDRDVSGVTGVELATIGLLTIEIGDEESLRIEAEDNLLEHFETEVRNGTLRINHADRIKINNNEPVNFFLTVRSLDSIKLSSAGNVQAPDLGSGEFTISLSSAGSLEMGVLTADVLKVSITSAGDVSIAGGKVETQEVSLQSAGDYDAENLESTNADVKINSAGNAEVWVTDNLKARLNSSGNLSYQGDPKLDTSSNSSGNVKPIDE